MAELLSDDGVPGAVAEALPGGRVLRCDQSCSVVHVEQQLSEETQLQCMSGGSDRPDTTEDLCCVKKRMLVRGFEVAPLIAGPGLVSIIGC